MQKETYVGGSPSYDDNDLYSALPMQAYPFPISTESNVLKGLTYLMSVPLRLLKSGFHVGTYKGDKTFTELWLHRTGVMPGVVLLDKYEAESLARLVNVASDGLIGTGTLFTRDGMELLVSSRRRGAVNIGVNIIGPYVHFSCSRARAMAEQLRSITCVNTDTNSAIVQTQSISSDCTH
ncbi:MAG: hypothetical protein ABI351_12410 [Herbaspirillum sp.]